MAYYQIEPFGEHRDDLRMATICTTIASCHGAKKIKPADFMPDFENMETPQDRALAMQQKFAAWAQMHNARLDNGDSR